MLTGVKLLKQLESPLRLSLNLKLRSTSNTSCLDFTDAMGFLIRSAASGNELCRVHEDFAENRCLK